MHGKRQSNIIKAFKAWFDTRRKVCLRGLTGEWSTFKKKKLVGPVFYSVYLNGQNFIA